MFLRIPFSKSCTLLNARRALHLSRSPHDRTSRAGAASGLRVGPRQGTAEGRPRPGPGSGLHRRADSGRRRSLRFKRPHRGPLRHCRVSSQLQLLCLDIIRQLRVLRSWGTAFTDTCVCRSSCSSSVKGFSVSICKGVAGPLICPPFSESERRPLGTFGKSSSGSVFRPFLFPVGKEQSIFGQLGALPSSHADRGPNGPSPGRPTHSAGGGRVRIGKNIRFSARPRSPRARCAAPRAPSDPGPLLISALLGRSGLGGSCGRPSADVIVVCGVCEVARGLSRVQTTNEGSP